MGVVTSVARWSIVLVICGLLVWLAVVQWYTVHPLDMPIPEWLQTESLAEHLEYHRRSDGAVGTRQWGSVTQDGPDRLLPHQCYWHQGILFAHPQQKSILDP